MVRGTPEQFIDVVKDRIHELEGKPAEASFVYPEDLEALEDGDYESHATEPINASKDEMDPVTKEVLDFFRTDLGWDTTRADVRNYADAVAEYIDMSRESGPYTMKEWYKDTKMNYPEELEEFEAIKSCNAPIKSAVEDINDNSRSKYLQDLTESVDDMLDGYLNTTEWDKDDKSLVLVTKSGSAIDEFTIPYEDLSFEAEQVPGDAEYIVGEVMRSLGE